MKLLHGPLIGAIWFGWVVYWFVAAQDAKPNRRRESRFSRTAHIVPLFIAIFLLAAPDRREGWFYARILPHGVAAYWVGVGALIAGLVFSVWSRPQLERHGNAEGRSRVDPYRTVPLGQAPDLYRLASGVCRYRSLARRVARRYGRSPGGAGVASENTDRGRLDDRKFRRCLSALPRRSQSADPFHPLTGNSASRSRSIRMGRGTFSTR